MPVRRRRFVVLRVERPPAPGFVIGVMLSLMLCLRMGEAGRVKFADWALEHSHNLLDRHSKLEPKDKKHGMARWDAIARSDQYGNYLIDAAMYLVQSPGNDNHPDLKEMVAVGKDLEKKRRQYLKVMDALCDAVDAAEPLHAEVSRLLAASD